MADIGSFSIRMLSFLRSNLHERFEIVIHAIYSSLIRNHSIESLQAIRSTIVSVSCIYLPIYTRCTRQLQFSKILEKILLYDWFFSYIVENKICDLKRVSLWRLPLQSNKRKIYIVHEAFPHIFCVREYKYWTYTIRSMLRYYRDEPYEYGDISQLCWYSVMVQSKRA